ncbi:hypothetical protein niasHT_020120 [Heterodera trifolii]|uniref:Uncharacterized protein n=1 Tax=Heterodera trifolii TaxID=157864 RepID=A0ABD2LJN3_9BILA
MDLSGSISMDSSSRNMPDQPGTSAGGGSDALSSTRQPSLISSLWSIQVQHEGSNSDFPMESPKGSLPEIVQASSCCHFQSAPGGRPNVFAAQQPIGAGGGISADHCQQLITAGGGAAAADHSLLSSFHHQHQQQTASSAGVGPPDGVGCSGFHMLPPPYGNSPSVLRPVKSLSDLSSLAAAGGGQMCSSQPFGQICPYSPPCAGHNNANANSQYGTMNSSNRRLTETGILYGGGLSKQQRDSQICDWLQTAMMAMRVGEGGAEGTGGSESPPEMGGTQFGQPRPTAQKGAEQQ